MPKHSVFIFHGTEGYPGENWFPWMKEKLEATGKCKVFVPQFPSPPEVPAKIAEWFDVLKSYEQYINEDTIIIGHSLGGKFLLRVLEKRATPIRAAIFVGTPIGIPPILNNERDEAFTPSSFDWKKVKAAAKEFIVYQSDDDPYVGIENGKELAARLGANLTFIPNAGHFNAKAGYLKFEDLLEKLREII